MKPITKNVIGAITILLVHQGQALAGGLPYMGPDKASNCRVQQPLNAPEDGGYLTDESCEIVYVKPPSLGRLTFISATKTVLAQACPSKSAHAAKMFEREKELYKLSGSAYEAESATLKQFYKSFFELQNWGATMNISASFDLNWHSLIRKYRAANPQIANIEPLPIELSTITIFPVLENNADHPLAKLNLDRPAYFALSALRIDHEQALAIPAFLRSSINSCTSTERNGDCAESYLVGQSASAKISLSFPQTCVLMDEKNQFHPNSAAGYIAATYTYFFKVESKAFYQVEVDKGAMLAALGVALNSRSHGELSAPDLSQIVEEKNAIIITSNPGYTGSPIELSEDRKNELRQFATGAFLAAATDSLSSAMSRSRYIRSIEQEAKSCTRFLGIDFNCHSHKYHIDIEQIDWSRVQERMAALGAGSYGAKDQTYTQFTMFDTSTYVPAPQN